MLSETEALREKIHSFIRRKQAKYPELIKPLRHEATYSGGFHKTIDPRPYIVTSAR
jgi:hypothetical protein